MVSKLAGVTAAAVALFLLAMAVIGGAPVASSAQPPTGGCAVTPHTGAGAGAAGGTQKSAELNALQMAAARTIAGVGKSMGIAERGIAIALGVAMQESTMNPVAVNGRSVGLFQQQGALYSDIDRTDPAATSRAFYHQLLTRVPNYADPSAGTFADIAQAVQQSGADASKYAAWERWATALAAHLIHGPATHQPPAHGPTVHGPTVHGPTVHGPTVHGPTVSSPTGNGTDDTTVSCEEGGGSGPIPIHRVGLDVTLPDRAGIDGAGRDIIVRFPTEQAAIATAAALSYLGTPYAWGGGGPNGPTQGIRDGGVADRHGDYNKIGFDCSGLTEYAYAQAGIAIGGDSRTQYARGGTRHPFRDAQPGDLLFIGDTPATIHHVAIYLGRIFGREYVLESPQSGDVVKVSITSIVGEYRTEIVRPWQ
jgi:peptidoglycan DL-endopeptidase RipA